MHVETVTKIAARLRVILSSSCKKAVDTSCSDINDVSAANDNSRKNSKAMT